MADSDLVKLPAPDLIQSAPLVELLALRRSVREFAAEPLRLEHVAQLLWAGQGITDPRGFRTAPSAGALYPLELHLVAGKVTGLPPGVYRYHPGQHQLEKRIDGDQRWALARAALDQSWMADAPAIIAIAAVQGRTTRKYGGRGIRYVHIEVGHAGQNIFLQAGALGLGTVVVGAFDDAKVQDLLGLDEEEQPVVVLPVGWSR